MIEFCRTCLIKVELEDSGNIFSVSLQNMLISEILKQIAPVNVSEEDKLPKIICKTCLEKLENTLLFRAQVVNSDFHLRCHKDYLEEDYIGFKNIDTDYDCKQESSLDIDENTLEYKPTDVNIDKKVSVDLEEENESCKEMEEKYISNDQQNNDSREVISTKMVRDKLELNAGKKKNKVFKCNNCNVKFKNFSQLKKHAIVHTGIVPYHCDLCKKGFAMKWQLDVHQKSHSDERPYKCEICQKTFKHKRFLTLHTNIRHLGIKPHKCGICSKAFSYPSQLEAHRRRHTGEKPFVCEFCSKNFAASDGLIEHLRIHSKQPEIPCHICGKTYTKKYLNAWHLKSHAGEKPHECKFCNKKFAAMKILNAHMRIHDGVKPYVCKICDKKFTHSGTLSKHKRIHTGERAFPCTSCEMKFVYKHHLTNHIKKEHISEISS